MFMKSEEKSKMKIFNKKNQGILTVVILLSVCFMAVSTAWATLSFIKSSEISPPLSVENNTKASVQLGQQSKSRAPEPTSMVLFGSGFLGMILTFVRRTYVLAKRLFDIFFSIVGMIILSPFCLVIALLIKLTSRGSILYTQTRVGKDGELFEIYKLRTMKIDAEKDSGPVWARANDNRLTPIGGFLRKAHIDEIPQFINVLRGEMSIIGPRPERPIFVDKFKTVIDDYEKRLQVKPGITGLAQVWHRYDETLEDVRKKIKYDLLYIRKLCLWTDLIVFMRTFRVVLTGEGAR